MPEWYVFMVKDRENGGWIVGTQLGAVLVCGENALDNDAPRVKWSMKSTVFAAHFLTGVVITPNPEALTHG